MDTADARDGGTLQTLQTRQRPGVPADLARTRCCRSGYLFGRDDAIAASNFPFQVA